MSHFVPFSKITQFLPLPQFLEPVEMQCIIQQNTDDLMVGNVTFFSDFCFFGVMLSLILV